MEKEIVVPGMRLCALEEDRYSAGRGTYAMHGYIYASIAGNLRLVSKVEVFNRLRSWGIWRCAEVF